MKNKKVDPDFYQKMLEAKKRKQAFLAQKRLHAEFGEIPLPPQVVIKTDAEMRMDAAFDQLKKNLAEKKEKSLTPQEKLADAFRNLERRAEGQ